MEYYNEDEGKNLLADRRVNSENPGRMGMLGQFTLIQFLNKAQVCLGTYKVKVDLGRAILARLDEEPGSTTLAKDRSLKHLTIDSTSIAVVASDGVSFDGSGANGINLPQVVQRLKYVLNTLGDVLGDYIRADLNESVREIELLSTQLSEKYWAMLGVNMSDESSAMLMVLSQQAGGILGIAGSGTSTTF
ncbi:MAG TPA: hypothetical protein DCQ04_10475 [Actinobacteria bacterium]|nr:hypothetical protein [Actinomycetota bacterium]